MPRLEAPKLEAPKLEAPKFEAPQLPKLPSWGSTNALEAAPAPVPPSKPAPAPAAKVRGALFSLRAKKSACTAPSLAPLLPTIWKKTHCVAWGAQQYLPLSTSMWQDTPCHKA